MRNANLWLAIVGLSMSLLGVAWKAGADQSAMQQQIVGLQRDVSQQTAVNEALRNDVVATRIMVARMCATTPGCRE